MVTLTLKEIIHIMKGTLNMNASTEYPILALCDL